jgi:HEAT repeat protein
MLLRLVFLFVCATGVPAQTPPPLTQEFVDWLPIAVRYQKTLSTGTTEAKREVLFQIRNLRSAEASRLAIPALRDSDEIVRATAAGSIVFLPANEAATALLPLLSDKAEMVRREAAYALGEAGDPWAVSALVTLLQRDKIIEVKGAAAAALGKIGDAGAVSPLDRILQDKPGETREFLRRSAARSIGQIAQFIQTGKVSEITPQNFLPERFMKLDKPKYPNLAANFPAFGPAVKTLIKTLQNKNESDDTRREAAFALGAIGDSSALQALQGGLGSTDPYLAEICKEAIARIRLAS